MGALRSLVARVRTNPWLAVGIAAAGLLVAAWLGWSIYVASDRGVNEGLGALIAWPAIVLGIGVVSLPFIGGYLLVRRLVPASDDTAAAPAADPPADPEPEEEDEEPEGDSKSDPEPEAAKS